MTVRELDEFLNGLDPEMRVVTRGYEGGYTEPFLHIQPIVLNYREKDYSGEHEAMEYFEFLDDEEEMKKRAILCLTILRHSPND